LCLITFSVTLTTGSREAEDLLITRNESLVIIIIIFPLLMLRQIYYVNLKYI
jgi:hypothetical protein